jgi:hypothetical protein
MFVSAVVAASIRTSSLQALPRLHLQQRITIAARGCPPGAAAHRNQLHILSSLSRDKQRVAAPGGQHASSRQLSGIKAPAGYDVDGKRVAQQIPAGVHKEQGSTNGGTQRAQSEEGSMLTACSQAVACGNSHLELSRPSVLSPSASAPRAKASLVGANTVTFAPGSESTCMHHTWRVPQQVWAPRRRAVPGRLHTRTARWLQAGRHSQAGAQSNPQRWGTTHLLQLGGGEGLGKGSQLGVLPDCLQSSRLAAAAAGNDPAVHNQAHKKPDGTGQVVIGYFRSGLAGATNAISKARVPCHTCQGRRQAHRWRAVVREERRPLMPRPAPTRWRAALVQQQQGRGPACQADPE